MVRSPIQFYLNNVTNLHQLTTHSTTSLTYATTWRSYRDHRLLWRHFTLSITRWLYCVECPQYSIRLEAQPMQQRWFTCRLGADYFAVNDHAHLQMLCRAIYFLHSKRTSVTWLLLYCAVPCVKNFDKFLRLYWKATPYGKIFKILFRKYSSRHRSTCCVQISWNLADGKSVKSCVDYLTPQLSLLRGSRPKSARASPRQCTQSAPDFIQIGTRSANLWPNAWTPPKRAVKWIQYSAEAYSFEPNNDTWWWRCWCSSRIVIKRS